MADQKHTKPYRIATPEELKRESDRTRKAKKQRPILRALK